MTWNTMKSLLDLKPAEFPVDIDKFVQVVIKFRSTINSRFGAASFLDADISDFQLMRLVTIAYFSSFTTEEGSYPSFSMFVYAKRPSSNRPNQHVELDRGMFFSDATTLSKYAGIANIEYQALVIGTYRQGFRVDGLMDISRSEIPLKTGRPEYWISGSFTNGVLITVLRPGAIRISWNMGAIRFESGEIHEEMDFNFVSGVMDNISRTDTLLKKRIVNLGPKYIDFFGGSTRNIVGAVWAQILRQTVNRGHGGTFVILGSEDTNGHIRPNNVVSRPHIGQEIVALWKNSVELKDPDQWLRLYTPFRRKISAVSNLANIDGCVCLSPDLKVISFGSRIAIEKDLSAKLPLANAITNRNRKEQGPEQFGGTRHGSAYSICKAIPNTLAFVISQDRHLRVFFSTKKKVYAFKNIYPQYLGRDL